MTSVTDHTCHVAGCALPVQDAYVCRACTDRLTGDLNRIISGHQRPAPPDYVENAKGQLVAVPRPAGWFGRDLSTPFDHDSGLLADLAASYARETRTGRGGVAAETPLTWHEKAGELRMRLCATLVRYARLVAETRRITLPDDAEALTVATWLLRHVSWLRHHEAGARAVTDIRQVVREIVRIIDPVTDRTYTGPCTAAPSDPGDCECACHDITGRNRPLCDTPTCATDHGDDICGRDLYALERAAEVVCRACRQRYDVKTLRAGLLKATEDVLGTATEISHALTRLEQPVTPERLRQWKKRGRLLPRGEDPRTQHPLYRVGDVQQLLLDEAAAAARRDARKAC